MSIKRESQNVFFFKKCQIKVQISKVASEIAGYFTLTSI